MSKLLFAFLLVVFQAQAFSFRTNDVIAFLEGLKAPQQANLR